MIKNREFLKPIMDMVEGFDTCDLSEIQAAFEAATAATADNPKRQKGLEFFLKCAMKAKNNAPAGLGNLAALFAAAERPDIAIPMLEKACGIDTDIPLSSRLQNRFNLGLLYSQSGRLPEALATHKEAIEIWDNRLNTQDASVFFNRVEDEAVNSKLYDALIQKIRAEICFTAGKIGLELLDQGKPEEAEPYLQEAYHYHQYLRRPDNAPKASTAEMPQGRQLQ